MNPELDRKITGILKEHEGVVVRAEGIAGEVRVRPLTIEDGLDLHEELQTVSQAVRALLQQKGNVLSEELLEEFMGDCQAALGKGSPALKKLLARCVDRPLNQIALPLAPAIIVEFLRQNFTEPRLRPWVALIGGLLQAGTQTSPESLGTLATPANSSSTTATAASTEGISSGGPSTSSSSGSGGA